MARLRHRESDEYYLKRMASSVPDRIGQMRTLPRGMGIERTTSVFQQIGCPRKRPRAIWTGRPSFRQTLARSLLTIRIPRRGFGGLSLYFSPARQPRIL